MYSRKNKRDVVLAKRRISTAYSLVAAIAVLQFHKVWLTTGLLIIVLATLELYARRYVYVKDITRFIG